MACGPNCTCTIFHKDILDKVNKESMDEEEVLKTVDFFKILANETRVKIIKAVSINELCVCDLGHHLNMTKSAVSHQLRILRDSGIVKGNKRGKMVYYELKDPYVLEVINKINKKIGDSYA